MAENIHKRPGSLRIHDKSHQLRYHLRKDQPDAYLQPLTSIRAGEVLKRGHLVSIALPEEYSKHPEWQEKEAYIVKTDTTKHEHALGIALEPSQVGDFVHIQNIGSFEFLGSNNEKQYSPDITEDDIGKMLWASSTAGELTTVKDEAISSYYTIRVGYILDAPGQIAIYNKPKVDLLIAGDLRGPSDITQFKFMVDGYITIDLHNPIRVFTKSDKHDRLKLADIKTSSNIIGVYFSNEYDQQLLLNKKYVFMDKGIYKISEGSDYKLTPNTSYYLGENGNIITQEKACLNYKIIKIGFALSETELLVDIKQPTYRAMTAFPVGHVKLSNKYTISGETKYLPSEGYLLCDGSIIPENDPFDVNDFPVKDSYKYTQLKEYLMAIYGEQEITAAIPDSLPDWLQEIPHSQIASSWFKLPLIKDGNNAFYEIKWEDTNTNYNQLTTIPYIRKTGVFNSSDLEIEPINITAIKNVILEDTTSNFSTAFDLSLYDIRFVVGIEDREWIELHPSNAGLADNSYSFSYILSKNIDDQFFLNIQHLNGNHVNGNILYGCPYRIMIAAKYLIPHQYLNINRVFNHPNIKSELDKKITDDRDRAPINSYAILKEFLWSINTITNINHSNHGKLDITKHVYKRLERLEKFLLGDEGSKIGETIDFIGNEEEGIKINSDQTIPFNIRIKLRKTVDDLKTLIDKVYDSNTGLNTKASSQALLNGLETKTNQTEFKTLSDKVNHSTIGLDRRALQTSVDSLQSTVEHLAAYKSETTHSHNITQLTAANITIGATENTTKFGAEAISRTSTEWIQEIGRKINGIFTKLNSIEDRLTEAGW